MAPPLSDLERYGKLRDGCLLDTNVISLIVGGKPLPAAVEHFFASISDDRLYLSVITIGEIRKGINLIPTPELEFEPVDDPEVMEKVHNSRKYQFARRLETLETDWAERILPVDIRVAEKWGELLAYYQLRGKPLPAIDALIAATAVVHNLAVVTHDTAFKRLTYHVTVYDPWSDTPQASR